MRNSEHGNQAPVVQKVDNAIHRINLYPLNSAIGFPNTYPRDGDGIAIHLLNNWGQNPIYLHQRQYGIGCAKQITIRNLTSTQAIAVEHLDPADEIDLL